VSVRRARPGDEDALRTVRLAAIADSPKDFVDTLQDSERMPREVWTRWIRNGAVFLAEVAGVVEGEAEGEVCGLTCGVPDKQRPELAWVAAVWVRPDLRGAGHADALMQAVVQWAVGRGFDTLRLEVHEDSGRARGFYERQGFVATGRITVRERDGARELEMDRELAGAAGPTGASP
jgi:GNAT superfamily N-acetyltransferase